MCGSLQRCHEYYELVLTIPCILFAFEIRKFNDVLVHGDNMVECDLMVKEYS